ncbi:MAG TPA: thioesterase family protein [Burkholderiales bacterium]|jgi:acyl-CoA thioester hydrolase|nr:thioesterase family protein [Burkholderiales bacterium]
MARTDFRFVYNLRVRWSEVDRQGIVFNGHYLTYFDVGVTEYYRAIGMPYPDAIVSEGADLYAKKAEIEYHASAEYDDLVDVCVRVARIGRSSFEFRVELYRGDELLVSGSLIYVNANPETRKSTSLPEFLKEAFRLFETTLPEEGSARR